MVYQYAARYYLEVALVVILGACVGLIYAVDGRTAVFGAVGLLSGVAARAMPALTRLLASITSVRVVGATLESLQADLRDLEIDPTMRQRRAPAGESGPDGVIALEAVTFRYPAGTCDALSGVSMEVRTGEIVAILGRSGTGKTSLVDVLVGLLAPTVGTVRFPRAATVGYVAQDPFVWDDGDRFNVSLGRSSASGDEDAEVWAALAAAHLSDWALTLPEPLDSPLGERGSRMSGGQRQRLGITRALYGDPSFLVLDEPTSALHRITSQSILETTLTELKQRVGIVVVTHDPLVVEYADRSMGGGLVFVGACTLRMRLTDKPRRRTPTERTFSTFSSPGASDLGGSCPPAPFERSCP